MGTGLVTGYGMFAAFVVRFLFPTRGVPRAWMFVANLAGTPVGKSIAYMSPVGHQVLITRIGEQGDADDFVALSSICPHLGCIVQRLPEGRFECPCHGSKFNATGEVFAGPSPSDVVVYEVARDDGPWQWPANQPRLPQ